MSEWYASASNAQKIVVSLSMADHMGDVNDNMDRLCDAFGLERGEWIDERDRFTFTWGPGEDDDDD